MKRVGKVINEFIQYGMNDKTKERLDKFNNDIMIAIIISIVIILI